MKELFITVAVVAALLGASSAVLSSRKKEKETGGALRSAEELLQTQLVTQVLDAAYCRSWMEAHQDGTAEQRGMVLPVRREYVNLLGFAFPEDLDPAYYALLLMASDDLKRIGAYALVNFETMDKLLRDTTGQGRILRVDVSPAAE